jgi:hypothetical protein
MGNGTGTSMPAVPIPDSQFPIAALPNRFPVPRSRFPLQNLGEISAVQHADGELRHHLERPVGPRLEPGANFRDALGGEPVERNVGVHRGHWRRNTPLRSDRRVEGIELGTGRHRPIRLHDVADVAVSRCIEVVVA